MLSLLWLGVACVQWEAGDVDGDGFTAPQGDCDDLDRSVGPGKREIWYDGIDQNCDGNDGDRDGDGARSIVVGGRDCWDDPSRVPEEFQVVPNQGFDQPEALEVFPAAEDVWYDGVDQNCDEVDDFDQDGDGAQSADHLQQDGSLGDDCDDVVSDVNPGGTETCDGVDQDCDLLVDEGASEGTWYYEDTDKDGYGDPDTSLKTCTPLSGWVTDGTDCDPKDETIYPGAEETCDEVDQDCDSAVDEDAIDPLTWYEDKDGDSYGVPLNTTEACDAPSGYAEVSGDCDDSDGATHPEASGTCDGLDRNCDSHSDPDEGLPGDTAECYGLSCLDVLTLQGTTLPDGLYWIDPKDSDNAYEAWCDMSTDGGGYTIVKLATAGTNYAEDAEQGCALLGLQLFIPRTEDHLLSAWAAATGTAAGGTASDDYLAIMGIYPDSEGATCARTPLTSSNGLCDWVAGDGGGFWVSISTTNHEPDGDNDVSSSMAYTFDKTGSVTGYTDTPYPGAGAGRYICSATDK